MNIQLTLAYRYLTGRKLRTFLTTLAIIFGVLLIFGMNSVLPTMMAALQANVQGLEGAVDFTITHISSEPFPTEVAAGLKDIDGVRAVSVSLNRTINLPADFIDGDSSRPDRVAAVNLVGIIPEEARTVRSYALITGRYLDDSDTDAALISQTLADALSVKVGDTIQLPSASGLTELMVVGILPANIMPVTEEILVNLPQAQQMTGETGKVNLIDLNVEAFANEDRRNEIQANIESTLGENYQVGALMSGDEMFAALEMGQIALSIFGALALFMGGFIIFNTFRTIVTERRRDIGMLRALGASRRTVIGIILAEGLLQGLLGSAIGILLGYLLAVGVVKVAQGPISQFINVQMGMPVISPSLVIISILLGLGVTVFAGLLPAWNASKIAPIEALRPSQVEGEYKRQTGAGFIVGIVILVITVAAIISGRAGLIIPGGFFFLVGLVLITPAMVRPFANLFGRIAVLATARQGIGDLAKNNLTRQPSRVAVTVSASMLALAIIVAAGGLVSSLLGLTFDMLKDNLGSDYLFVPPSIGLWGSNLGANPSLAEDLRQIESVEDVSTLRYAASSFNGNAISLLGIEPEAFQAVSGLVFSEGNESDYAKISTGRNMIVNSAFTLATGMQVGDTIELLTTNGKVPYQIVAVASDMLNAKFTTAYISQENLLADFGSNEDVFIQLNLAKNANREAAGEQIKALAADYPQFKLIAGADYYATMKAQGEVAFSAIYIVFAILAFPSLIAMLNTLTINVLERTREIGMIRAVGGTRKQLRNMVLTEALMLAAIGTAFGIMGGIYLGYVFVKGIEIMFPTGYHFPTSGVLAAIVIGLLVGAVAALIPARQAAKMNVIAALRYE